jgi:23S rRNA pseudouridine1911/1915/1917 synthase
VIERIPGPLAGERVDRVVAMMLACSRAEAAELVANGAVRLDGRTVTARSRKVQEGDSLDIDVPDVAPDAGMEADPSVEFEVVHEDADVLIVDKPAGVVVHPGAGQRSGTLVHGLLARYPEIRAVGQPDRPGIVHRLDKGTSGLLLVARSEPAYEGLVAALSAHDVERRYRTLVWGHLGATSGIIDAPIGRSNREPTKMAVSEQGKPARTRYEVVATYSDPVEVTELICRLETGRTHQIRVHLSSIGHAVVGDPRYGGRRQTFPAKRPFLHAERLELRHPISGEPIAAESPLPPDLVELRGQLD